MTELEPAFPSGERHDVELRAMAELERLPGVLAAAVWLNGDRQLRDARLYILPGATHMIISNAAARVLQSLNIAFEPGTLRITTLGVPEDLPAAPASGRFLLLQDLTLTRLGSHVTCRVQILRADQLATGEARELDTTTGRARAAALATLRAAEAATEGLALGLEAASLVPLFGRSYAVVSVEAAIGRRAITLSGLVTVDPVRGAEEAMCMAALRAIDRWAAARWS